MNATRRSLPYDSKKGCPPGFHHREGYKSVTGKYVEPRCVRATTTYKESRKNFEARQKRRMTERLRKVSAQIPRIKNISRKVCPPGMIERQPYVRRFSTAVRQRGYTVKKASGTTYRVYPKAKSAYVKAKCIKDLGKPGKGVGAGESIGALRKGELKKYGYSSSKSDQARHAALRKAVDSFGALGVFRKLVAVANYTVRTQPEKSRVYREDAKWIKESFSKLVAF
jgi:Family of unknown function (DUF5771)